MRRRRTWLAGLGVWLQIVCERARERRAGRVSARQDEDPEVARPVQVDAGERALPVGERLEPDSATASSPSGVPAPTTALVFVCQFAASSFTTIAATWLAFDSGTAHGNIPDSERTFWRISTRALVFGLATNGSQPQSVGASLSVALTSR